MKTFKVSQLQIQHIKQEDPIIININQKRPDKFTKDIKTPVLIQFNQPSTTHLPKLSKFIKEKKIDLSVFTHEAISNLIHNMHISSSNRQILSITKDWTWGRLWFLLIRLALTSIWAKALVMLPLVNLQS